MVKPLVIEPEILTLLTTFKCTAMCQNCCFQCSPIPDRKMSFEEMKTYVNKCLDVYPSIKCLVFTGGECTLLKEDLLRMIQYANSKGLFTRIVTNGWWARSYAKAVEIIKLLKSFGLKEINFSTGDDHQRWIPFRNIRNAAVAAAKNGIGCAINIETHDKSKFKFNQVLLRDKVLLDLCNGDKKGNRIFFENGIWAPFSPQNSQKISYEHYKDTLKMGRCDNLFNNIPINPYGEVLACCGITSESNPYLRIGNINRENIRTIYERSFQDLLKIWLYTEGPKKIMEFICSKKRSKKKLLPEHMCLLCRKIFCNQENLYILQNSVKDYSSRVLLKYSLMLKKNQL